ncbi:MAG: ArsR family transcriptional regulator [Thermococcus sp.]|nr:ArsR family transcriptional regulator [Thermococcus sp.]
MKNRRVLEVLKNGPMTIEEISSAAGLKPLEVRRYLLRFVEQGKVESFQKEGRLFWKLREKRPEDEEFKYV